jgi:cobalt transporter subunit CbtB
MTTKTLTSTSSGAATGLLPIVAALILGLGLIFVAGLSQAAVLHDAAHDTRHAIAFPCH